MSQKYEKLKALLKELFQLDQPDLDFGLYRVMHAKAAEVTQFLDKDLLPQVKEAFSLYKTADKAELEKELAKVVGGVQAAGMDPEQSPKVQELRAKLANDAVDLTALENEVYDHLFSFFRRYYSEGDFLAKRVYKPGVYAIPYEGEEVKLHWANRDQYYIKTSEYLRDYAFRLRPDNDKNPMRVHFRLVDAVEGEHGNVKAAEGKDRVFILATDGESGRGFIAEEDGQQGKELSMRFEYRPATLNDWPEEARVGKTKPPAQKDLTAFAVHRILTLPSPSGRGAGGEGSSLDRWIAELAKPHVKADCERADYNRLEAHLRRYTARNTFDYFVHKDLGGFLRRELDFYVKNEVMHLDDVDNETAPRVEQYLSKIRVIRRIAGKIIEFLAQLEDFQKKLWMKKKFVVETNYCITLDRVPEELYPEIAGNDLQCEEWVRLFSIDKMQKDLHSPGYAKPLAVGFLRANQMLPVDTRCFSSDFKQRLLSSIQPLDDSTCGCLIHGENFQALQLLQISHRGMVNLSYADPPYNTGSDGFLYKDSYQRSCWIAMMRDRLALVRSLLSRHGASLVSCDDNEQARCAVVLYDLFGEDNFVTSMVWEGGRKNDAKQVSVSHEYVLVACKDIRALNSSSVRWRQRKDGIDAIYRQATKLKRKHGNDYETASQGMKEWYATLPDNNPSKKHKRYFWIDSRTEERGPYFADKIAGPDDGRLSRPRDEVLHPVTKKPVKMPGTGWCWSDIQEKIRDGYVHFGKDETTVPNKKTYLRDTEYEAPHSVFYKDGRGATILLDSMLPSNNFSNPKDVEILARLFSAMSSPGSLLLDCFGGSGTTGHAVIALNREGGEPRRFVLVEMGPHFDSVMKPRLLKAAYARDWKNGEPVREEGVSQIIKYLRLESYEDTLNNLEARRSPVRRSLLDTAEAHGADKLKEQYILRYMLDVETRGSQSLLNVRAFTDPTAYKLKVKRPGSDESREVNVDLLETFNWLIGLTVQHIAAPQTFSGRFERDSEKRLRLKRRIKADDAGPYWFRTVTGTTPDGRKTLIIWRKRPGGEMPDGIEQDNLVLDEWFTRQGYSSKDSEFDLIYVNGSNNLENLKAPDDTWKVRLIEEDFHRLMFDTEGA